MDEKEILIKVSKGQKVKGYELIQSGIDAKGKYKQIKTPEGKVKKVYIINQESIKRFFCGLV